MLSRALDKVTYIKTQRGSILRIVREHYLRHDVLCHLPSCAQCAHRLQTEFSSMIPPHFDVNQVNANTLDEEGISWSSPMAASTLSPLTMPTLSSHASHIVIPEGQTLLNYLELFQSAEFNNLIICQRFLDQWLERGGSVNRQRVQQIRKIVLDPRRSSIWFDNEHFFDTCSSVTNSWTKGGNELLIKSEQLVAIRLAWWYQQHWHPVNGTGQDRKHMEMRKGQQGGVAEWESPSMIDIHQSSSKDEDYPLIMANRPSPLLQNHGKPLPQVIYITQNVEQLEMAKTLGINAQTISQYLDNFYLMHNHLLALYESITHHLIEEANEDVDSVVRLAKEQPFSPSSLSDVHSNKKITTSEAVPKSANWTNLESFNHHHPNTKFSPYWDDNILKAARKSGLIYEGQLEVNSYNPAEAFVLLNSIPSKTSSTINIHGFNKILIPNKIYRNRAIHQDIVAVELIDPKDWTRPSLNLFEAKMDEETKMENDVDERSDAQERKLTQMISSNSDECMPCGRVVGLFERRWRSYVCTFQLQDDGGDGKVTANLNSTAKNDHCWAIAVPWDYRIPNIRLRTRQYKQLCKMRIMVTIDKWNVDSYYPQGHYVKSLGLIGDHESEIQVLLEEHHIDSHPFDETLLAELPFQSISTDTPWKPDELDLKTRFGETQPRRRDLRNWKIYSIDPIGCKDVDDALSCRQLKNGNWQVGVHIADVSTFVRPGSRLDLEACSRGTSVYLVDRRIEMLPSMLSENICSLRSGQDRYAVTVLWEFNEDAQILNTWMGQTLIRSSHQMYYEEAQQIIDCYRQGASNGDQSVSLALKKKFGEDLGALQNELSTLARIYQLIHHQRLEKGALELSSFELTLKLDEDNNPISVGTKDQLEVHGLVAEFMILANCTVAKFIYTNRPQSVLLRKHPLPKQEKMQELVMMAHSKGHNIDYSSNLKLAQSLSYAAQLGDHIYGYMLKVMATMAMSQAVYFSSGSCPTSEYYHYGLATEFYTHFTSPIRRYSDILVHRQLLALLNLRPDKKALNNTQLQAICDHLNTKKQNARKAEFYSTQLYQLLYFKLHKHELSDQTAIIISIKNNGFLVYLPKFGLKAPVHLQDNHQLLIPENALSLNPACYKSDIHISSFEPSPDRTMMVMHTNQGSFKIALFEYLTVKVKVIESRSHISPLKLELVHFGSTAEYKQSRKLATSDENIIISTTRGKKKKVQKAKTERNPPTQMEVSMKEGTKSLVANVRYRLENMNQPSPKVIEPCSVPKQLLKIYRQSDAHKCMHNLIEELSTFHIDELTAKAIDCLSYNQFLRNVELSTSLSNDITNMSSCKIIGRRVFREDEFHNYESNQHDDGDKQGPGFEDFLSQRESDIRMSDAASKAERDFKANQLQVAKSKYKPRS